MRFKKLQLAAFLSFKEKTEIDFAQFGNQLILLFGGSGVGKTAIFDGITFALYGRGSGKDRCAGKVEDYHSDFAKEQDEQGITIYRAPMVVELEFEHDGKDYVVSREIKWGENGKNKGFTYEMELLCEGVCLVSDTKKASNGSFAGNFEDKVSAYIKGMLGLNAEQFSQVVILAQGEFAKFLNANAQEREEILTKLVDNEGYVDFQLRLKEMKNYLKRVIDSIDAEIEQHLNILRARPTISEAEKQQYAVVDEELLVALAANLENKVQQINALQGAIAEQEAQIRELSAQKGAADEQNNLFDKQSQQLRETQGKLAALKSKFDIQRWERVLGDLVKLQEILPQYEAYHNAVGELEQNAAAVQGLEQAMTANSKQEALLRKAKETVEQEHTPQISALEGTLQKLEAALALYPALQRAEAKEAQLLKQLAGAVAQANTDANTYNQALVAQDGYERDVALLGNAQASKLELEAQLKEAQLQLEELGKLREAVRDVRRKLVAWEKHRQLEQQAEAVKHACLEGYDIAQQEYYAAEQKFQSGSLANKVREQAQAKQLTEVECPVCHTIHRVEALAQWESCAELPEKTALEEKKAAYEGAVQRLVQAQNESSTSKVAYEIAQQNALQKAQELLGVGVNWEELQKPDNPLLEALEKVQAHRDKVAQLFATAKEKAQQQAALQAELDKNKARLPALKKAWDDSVEALNQIKEAEVEQKNAVAKVQGMLVGCPDTQEQAQAQLDQAQRAKAALEKGINEARSAYNSCVQTMANDRGKLEQAQHNQEALLGKAAGCKDNYEAALAGCGVSEETFLAMHEACKDRSGAKLTSKNVAAATNSTRSSVERYRKEEANYLHTIASLTKELQGKQRVDTTALVQEMAAVNGALKDNKEAKETLQTDREFMEQTLQRVKACYHNRLKKQKVHRVIEPLAEAANGSITFNRYVLEDLFCSMLDKANDRLSVLCSGQYELRPIQEGQAKKNTGLGFTVYDCINQSHRESGANSGGEKFEISLSLALGLSDIVQSCSKKASRIESLFIDEGFGTLGKEELEKTKKLLLELSGGSRQIGIISHNPVLEEAIKNQIVVERDKQTREGSKISFNLDLFSL